jgi:glycosyltransferase involved in cell wall biosynthesis
MSNLAVIIETYNATPETEIQLQHVLDRLNEQSYPLAKIEVIVVRDEANQELAEFLSDHYPHVKQAALNSSNYFSMKNCGLQLAQSDIIAFLDGDCIPSKNWAERIVSNISQGADVSVGKTRYPSHKPFARTFDFFDFGHVQADKNGEANCFVVNNVAFKKQIIEEHNFDNRLGRSGGCYLLSRQLKSLNYKLVYDPEQFAVHEYNIKGLGFIGKRIRLGFDAINLCQLDDEGVLAEKKFYQFGILAPFVIFLSRVFFDLRRMISNHKDLNIPLYAIPYFCLASILMRSIEIIGGIITVVKPNYFKIRFNW